MLAWLARTPMMLTAQLVIRAMRPGPQLARDAPIAKPWELPLHERNGRTEVGIGHDGVLVSVARPPEVLTRREPDHATSSLGGSMVS